MKQGIVFCHGHKHQPIDNYFLKMAQWSYCDRDENSEPDLVVNLMSPEARNKILALLPPNQLFDYVLVYNCPIGGPSYPRVTKNFMLLARSLLKEGGQFIFYNYFGFAIGYYINTFYIVKKYLNGQIEEIHGFPEEKKMTLLGGDNDTTEIATYMKMLTDEDQKGGGPFLDYCLSIAKTLGIETGYSSLSYLDDQYRPANASLKGKFRQMHQNSKKYTLVFEAGNSLIQENLKSYIPPGFHQNADGWIVEDKDDNGDDNGADE
jgi:hypothetical protein